MNEQRLFLEAIRADPDDDLLRLAFADWLEENGKGLWASVIRQQIESAKRNSDDLDERWKQDYPLIPYWQDRDVDRLREEMGYPVPIRATDLVRGLVGRLSLTPADFLDFGPALAAWGPMPALHLDKLAGCVDDLGRCSALGEVSSLQLGA